MQINYQAMALRPGHYAITNQGKGSVALVQTIDFNVWGSRICLIKQKRKKSQKLKSIFLYFEVIVSSCLHFFTKFGY